MGHHDLFFKKTFSILEHAADFLRHVLPKALDERMDYDSLALEKGSHVDSNLAEYFTDTLYSCRCFGSPVKLAFLLEHKSAPDRDLPFQLHRYMANVWKNSARQGKPRMPIIPVVLYHGTEAWKPGPLSSRFPHLPDAARPYVPDFEYVFVDLSAYSDRFVMERLFTSPTLRIAILVMKNVFDQDLLARRLVEFLALGRSAFREKRGLKFLKSVIIYLYKATDIETEGIVRAVAEINAKGGRIAMSTAEKIRKEGRKEGIVFLVRNAKKQGLSEDAIAGIVGLDADSVRKILNREDFDVPLHLLDWDLDE